jgi:hypothetical protein
MNSATLPIALNELKVGDPTEWARIVASMAGADGASSDGGRGGRGGGDGGGSNSVSSGGMGRSERDDLFDVYWRHYHGRGTQIACDAACRKLQVCRMQSVALPAYYQECEQV